MGGRPTNMRLTSESMSSWRRTLYQPQQVWKLSYLGQRGWWYISKVSNTKVQTKKAVVEPRHLMRWASSNGIELCYSTCGSQCLPNRSHAQIVWNTCFPKSNYRKNFDQVDAYIINSEWGAMNQSMIVKFEWW